MSALPRNVLFVPVCPRSTRLSPLRRSPSVSQVKPPDPSSLSFLPFPSSNRHTALESGALTLSSPLHGPQATVSEVVQVFPPRNESTAVGDSGEASAGVPFTNPLRRNQPGKKSGMKSPSKTLNLSIFPFVLAFPSPPGMLSEPCWASLGPFPSPISLLWKVGCYWTCRGS